MNRPRKPHGPVTTAVVGATGLLAAAVAPFTAAAAPAGPPSPCGAGGVLAAAPATCTYTAVGTDTFTVPDGVSEVGVDLFGAEGGSAAGYVLPNPPNDGAPGGLGGETRARLAVRPGQVLQLTVGQAGSSGTSRHGEFARPGGTGHGPGGGGAHGGGGSGGGGTDLRTGTFGPMERVLVAGGGGGAGNGGPLLRGGNGGGPAGEPGGQGGGPDGSGVAGGGGSQSAPGTGSPNSALGGPGGAGSGTDQWTGLPEPGSGGTGGNGARGGNGGGGGGGGWFGGGGGSGGGNPGNLYGAGGGGGSGYAAPGTADAVLLQGVHHGDGRAVVSFRYDTGVDVTADTDRPLFGHPVTLTAAVVPAAPVGTPGGTVTFLDGADELATVPLAGGRAAFTTAALRPGAHAITARYGGDALFTPSTTAEPAAPTVGFSAPCTTGVHRGPLTVDPGEALCLAPGARQEGPVTVRAGGALAVTGASVTGPLTADGALAVRICGGDLTGPLTLRRTVGAVQSGPAGDPADCAGSTVHGPVTAEDNTGGVVFSALRVTGPLRCAGNVPAPVLVAAVVDGPRSGQCR